MNALVHYSAEAVWNAPFMGFTLTYDGPLPASANKRKNQAKWKIRKHFHPQAADLWANHRALKVAAGIGEYPLDGGLLIQVTICSRTLSARPSCHAEGSPAKRRAPSLSSTRRWKNTATRSSGGYALSGRLGPPTSRRA
jgi:hypothetical protein